MSEGQVVLHLYPERDFLKAGELDQEIMAVLEIVPPTPSSQVKTGTDMVLLLDTSGSMNESFYNTGLSKKQVVVEAAKSLLPLMNDLDTITAISFNTTATVLLDHERKSAATRVQQGLDALLRQNGQTNFEEAMRMAQAMAERRVNPVQKFVFLTDGNPWGGDTKKALNIAAAIVARGNATLDAMGIGGDFNFALMRQFSAFSGGITENILELQQTQQIFRQILRSGQTVIATDLQLAILFSPQSRDMKVYQSAPEKRLFNIGQGTISPQGTFYNLPIGDLSMRQTKQFAIRGTADLPDGTYMQIANILLSYKDPVSGENRKTEIAWNLNLAADSGNVRYDTFVTDVFREIELLMESETAFDLYQKGFVQEAVKKYKSLIDAARQLGDAEQARMYETAYNKIIHNEKLTQEELNRMLHRSSRASRVRAQPVTSATRL